MKKPEIIIFIIGSVITLGWGILSVYLGSQDNNQGEFYDFQTGAWDIPYAVSWILYPFVVWCICFFIVYGIIQAWKMYVR